ncbi:uncharacterized protein FIBRA_04812 [Fibroporia radiculosa]|uniref:Uncharacterized protein n=1 Tax=Fibroporia radiculosa TaxID=599839 RepID=J4IAD2_9APHY|nr:uncharacterized protein FIBRA_04812 [Fibroporia radiculosa]CCM02706.1 predicted protein [Fibroporia radiculosa]
MSFEKAEKAESGEITQVDVNYPTSHSTMRPSPSPAQLRKLGNPGPLGLFAFASTTLWLSFVNAGVRDINAPNAVASMALFVGGLCQLLAGMWEFACGNSFGATAFSMFGGFWMSYATIFIPGSGILAAYADNTTELNNMLGLYLEMWFIITSLLFIASTRRTLGLAALFLCLAITFLLLGIGKLVQSTSTGTTKAGGAMGIITAFIAFYVGTAQLLVREESWFTLPVGHLPQRLD